MNSGFSRDAVSRIRDVVGKGISRNLVFTFGARSGLVLLEFVAGLMLARILGASRYGVYAYVMAWIGVLAVPAAAGFDRLLIREVATRKARHDWPAIKGLLRFSTSVVLTCALSIAAVLCLLSGYLAHGAQDLRTGLLWGSLLLPLIAYARVRQAMLQGLGHVVAGQIPETLVQPGTFVLAVAALYLTTGHPQIGSEGLLLQVGAAGIACLVGVVLLRARIPAAVVEASPRFLRREWIFQALPFVWLLAMNMALMNLDTLVLGALQGPGDVGVYRVASQMAALVMFPLTAINLITAPKIAAFYGAGDLNRLQATVRHGARLAFAGGAVIAVLLVVLGRPALRMFGSEFEDGYKALVILVLGYLANSAVGVAGYVLIMTKFERIAALLFMLAVLTDFTLCSLLIPKIGIDGAAIGTTVSIILLGLLMAVFTRRRLGIDATAFSRPPDKD